MKRIIIFTIILILILSLRINAAHAADFSAGQSAIKACFIPLEKNQSIEIKDDRVIQLQAYLESHKSPLAPYAKNFVEEADKNDLPWHLVAAISGVESTFGKRIPKDSYNAYGWANGDYSFKSWEDSIAHVSKVLREKYYNDGLNTVEKISRRYAPPSKTWAGNVKFFMGKIENFEVKDSKNLTFSL